MYIVELQKDVHRCIFSGNQEGGYFIFTDLLQEARRLCPRPGSGNGAASRVEALELARYGKCQGNKVGLEFSRVQ
jgi:hypothetical protein